MAVKYIFGSVSSAFQNVRESIFLVQICYLCGVFFSISRFIRIFVMKYTYCKQTSIDEKNSAFFHFFNSWSYMFADIAHSVW